MKRLLIGAALSAALSAAAADVTFTYNTSGAAPMAYGFDKKDIVRVAILIHNPELVGKKIKGLSVEVPCNTEGSIISATTGFIATNIELGKKWQEPDICSVPATVSTPSPAQPRDNFLTCTFPEPYTITEDRVFVGYTIEVSAVSGSLGHKPIAVVEGDAPFALLVNEDRNLLNKWADKGEANGIVSAMEVMLEGDFRADAAGFILGQGYDGIRAERNDIMVRVANYGYNALQSVKYTVDICGRQETDSLVFDTPIPPVFGAQRYVNVSLPPIDTIGEVPFAITLDEANGVAVNSVAKSNFSVAPFVAVNRPLVEEYTGTWCGWCPQGFAALEQLNRNNPDRFVALAYHNYNGMDRMATMTNSQYPSSVSGYPAAFINRGANITPVNLLSQWPAAAEEKATTLVTTDLEWADDEETVLKITTTASFVNSLKGKTFRMSAALCADSLYDEKWVQANYLSNNAAYSKLGPEFEFFVKAGSVVSDLKFNDVVLSFKDCYFGSVEDEITETIAFESYSHSTLYDLKSIRNVLGDTIIQNTEYLYGVGVLFDERGAPVNCSRSAYAVGGNLEKINETAIRELEASEIKSEEYFDLQGRPLVAPQSGQVAIRRVRLKDGTVQSFKHRY